MTQIYTEKQPNKLRYSLSEIFDMVEKFEKNKEKIDLKKDPDKIKNHKQITTGDTNNGRV